jgi:hypothetical protein
MRVIKYGIDVKAWTGGKSMDSWTIFKVEFYLIL